mgnify:CR=1 FL=1
MVLNVQDEIINGTPKYNITPNGDGTSSIELANEVLLEGTPLNRNIFNKIENVLSYQVPTYTQSGGTETYTTDITPTNVNKTWSGKNSTIGETFEQNLTTYGGITPKIIYTTNLNNFVANDSKVSGSVSVASIQNYGAKYTKTDFLTNSQRKSNLTGYYNQFMLDNSYYVCINFDMIKSSKVTFDWNISATFGNLIFEYSDDNINWYTEAASFAGEHTTATYHRYWRVKFTATSSNSYITIMYLYIKKVVVDNTTYDYILPTVTNIINNQRVLLMAPNDISSASNNNLNNIQIDTILTSSKYYELVYNQSQNKFIAQEVLN